METEEQENNNKAHRYRKRKVVKKKKKTLPQKIKHFCIEFVCGVFLYLLLFGHFSELLTYEFYETCAKEIAACLMLGGTVTGCMYVHKLAKQRKLKKNTPIKNNLS